MKVYAEFEATHIFVGPSNSIEKSFSMETLSISIISSISLNRRARR